MISANIRFNGTDTAYFIKFGKKEYLEKIKEGEIRFCELSCFYDSQKKSAIYDKYEGIKYLKHHKNGKTEWARIKEDVFISCFSYFTEKDVLNNKIFSPEVLKEKDWSHVLFILDSDKFRENIENSLSNYTRESRLITYLDYSQDQDNLTIFNKSDEYAYEKEFRFAFYPSKEMMFLKREKRTVNIMFKKVDGIIVPINEFIECFSIE